MLFNLRRNHLAIAVLASSLMAAALHAAESTPLPCESRATTYSGRLSEIIAAKAIAAMPSGPGAGHFEFGGGPAAVAYEKFWVQFLDLRKAQRRSLKIGSENPWQAYLLSLPANSGAILEVPELILKIRTLEIYAAQNRRPEDFPGGDLVEWHCQSIVSLLVQILDILRQYPPLPQFPGWDARPESANQNLMQVMTYLDRLGSFIGPRSPLLASSDQVHQIRARSWLAQIEREGTPR